MGTLFLIPARGGSKGIPGKNIKPLNGKPLIGYSIDIARQLSDDEHICVSTDSEEIINVVQNLGLDVPFVRPEELSSDTASSYDVILHAVNYFREKSVAYDRVVLLQPTSPFRTVSNVRDALKLFSSEIDAIVSVHETKSNPYYVLVEETEDGFLKKSKTKNITRRQDAPIVYEINGSIYVINVSSLRKYHSIMEFPKIKKLEIPILNSVDIDEPLDWMYCEFLLEKNLI